MANMENEITNSIFKNRENESKHPSYENEMHFYELIKEGRIDELKKARIGKPDSDDRVRGVLSDNPLRNAMYHFVVMTAMVTRFCIDGGLEPNVAYEMSDVYIKKADEVKTRNEIMAIQEEMIFGFAKTMANQRKKTIYSKQIVLCIDYISQNLHDNITVTELAEYVNLNETYLSKLFKKEMGESISEYIRDRKVEAACRLLRYSDKSSIEIATDLGFSSHSYFISVFKKTIGMTPREYRNTKFRKNWKEL